MKALTLLAAILVCAAPAFPQTVTTPALRVDSGSTALCRITNITGASIGPDVFIKDASTGSNLNSDFALGVAYQETQELTHTGTTALMYCRVDFASNSDADDSRVSLVVQDASGMAVSSVRGVRLGTHLGTASVVTPSLNSGTSVSYECSFLNADTSAQTVTMALVQDNASTAASASGVSISAGQAYTLSATTDPSRCRAIASSGSNATGCASQFTRTSRE